MLLELEEINKKVKEVRIKKALKVQKSFSVPTGKGARRTPMKKMSTNVTSDSLMGIESGATKRKIRHTSTSIF
jgi:hypothetical protein